jgi:hypothetical protein
MISFILVLFKDFLLSLFGGDSWGGAGLCWSSLSIYGSIIARPLPDFLWVGDSKCRYYNSHKIDTSNAGCI